MLRGLWLAPVALIVLSACQSASPVPVATSAPTAAPTAVPKPTAAPAAPTTAPSAPPATGATRGDLLNAADAAYASGKSEDAAGLYERVINTPPAADEPPPARVAITDYAHFRAMVALLTAGREDDARAHLEALRSREASAPLPRLADQFWNQYSMTASVKAACAQLQPEIATQAGPVLSTLQSLGVGADPAKLCSVA
jgi:hypothetical protein